jgi:hypothetical protein
MNRVRSRIFSFGPEANNVADSDSSSLLVTGDVIADWILAVPSTAGPPNLQAAYQWQSRNSTLLSAQAGAAALLSELVAAASNELTVSGPTVSVDALRDPMNAELSRSFSLWQPYPASVGRTGEVWRMHRFLGLRPAPHARCLATGASGITICVAIDDAGLGFRSAESAWPEEILNPSSTAHFVLKMASPIGEGPLWDRLIANHADRLTVYLALGDLRKADATIGQPLSWEQLAGEIATAVRDDPALSQAARVVVSAGLAGAVLIERNGTASLVFDPDHQEGDWERLHPGLPSGLGTCVAAALSLAAVRNPDKPEWHLAIARGLRAGRAVHSAGYAHEVSGTGDLRFPVGEAVELLVEAVDPDAIFTIASIEESPDWQLLPVSTMTDYRALADRLVQDEGTDTYQGLPVERMGAWMSMDRTEIESIRSLRNITRQYLAQQTMARPLNLAVFGPPGSGKSFAVKQMAREWSAAGTRLEVLEFNVAQFESGADLATSLQRVRDSAVQQVLPLVFWDEFDSPFDGRELGWLARFLAPMQDGVFLEAGTPRPIGPAIFVFAGGTHSSLASFKDRAVTLPGTKATDFLSRLRGHIDVLGPNPRDEADRGYILRRALLLRSILFSRAPHLAVNRSLSIDPGVLRAFLEAPLYLHGARSIEAIVEMSALAGRLRYERSSLPARHQLALHVDADAFLDLAAGNTGQ